MNEYRTSKDLGCQSRVRLDSSSSLVRKGDGATALLSPFCFIVASPPLRDSNAKASTATQMLVGGGCVGRVGRKKKEDLQRTIRTVTETNPNVFVALGPLPQTTGRSSPVIGTRIIRSGVQTGSKLQTFEHTERYCYTRLGLDRTGSSSCREASG